MDNPNDAQLLAHLVELTRQVARNEYSRVEELFGLTGADRSSEVIRELAEAFGMMVVQVEGREFRLERLVEDLKQANQRLEAALAEVRASDMAKQKVIDHLSHELKTPLAIISAAFHRLGDKLSERERPRLAKTIDRGLRSVSRLTAVQETVDDIIHHAAQSDDRARYRQLIDEVADMVEDLSEEETGIHRRLLDRIRARIEAVYRVAPVIPTTIRLDRFVQQTCNTALKQGAFREVRLTTDLEPGLLLEMDRTVFGKVCDGLLKNAIENTPDGGAIHIITASTARGVELVFKDTGVGIAPEDRKYIFGGFFHTQETDAYSTKKPYQFNAGGTGSDLLRIKAFSDRFDFTVSLTSRRCIFLRAVTDRCPGRIGDCRNIGSKAECAAAGGSEFRLSFDTAEKTRVMEDAT